MEDQQNERRLVVPVGARFIEDCYPLQRIEVYGFSQGYYRRNVPYWREVNELCSDGSPEMKAIYDRNEERRKLVSEFINVVELVDITLASDFGNYLGVQ